MNKIVTNIKHTYSEFKSLQKSNNRVLSENAILRYFSFSSLYGAQGIPEGLTYFAIPAWLATQGKTALEIGSYIGIIGIPWSFKILIAPIIDRYTFIAMGRKRPWVILGQVGLVFSLLLASFIPDPLNNLYLLMGVGFCISLFGTIQDVAVDGMAIDIVPVNEQARANGLMWGSKIIGRSLSLVVSTWIINSYGFHYAAIFLAVTVAFIALIPIFIKENSGEKLLPWTIGEASAISKAIQIQNIKLIFKNLFKVFFLPTSLIMGFAVFFIAIGKGFMDALLPVFTIQKIGWTNTDYSQVMAVTNVVAGILGMFIGGALVDIYGKIKMMSIYLSLLIVLILIMVVSKTYWEQSYFIPGFIFFYYTLITFLNIAVFATAMELSWKRISATQFTLYMAINNLGDAAGASYMGNIKNYLVSWDYVISIFAIAAIIMLILLFFMNTEQHLLKVNQLENNHLISEKV
ncbi:MAG TPA: MFS transporter [Flavobacterium sp.]|nr:MFS transporter [Flavobacterium sp.]